MYLLQEFVWHVTVKFYIIPLNIFFFSHPDLKHCQSEFANWMLCMTCYLFPSASEGCHKGNEMWKCWIVKYQVLYSIIRPYFGKYQVLYSIIRPYNIHIFHLILVINQSLHFCWCSKINCWMDECMLDTQWGPRYRSWLSLANFNLASFDKYRYV